MDLVNKYSNKYFNTYYQEIFTNFLNEVDNENILIININQFNPLLFFSHYFKRFNIHLYLVFHHHQASLNINEEIKNEECKKYIHNDIYSLNEIVEQYRNMKFNKIILFHIRSIEYLKKELDICMIFKCKVYIYISLSKKFNILYKNLYRGLLKKIDSNEPGYVFDYNKIFVLLNTYQDYEIESINLIKNKHYAVYGNNQNYQIILNPKNKN